MRAARLGIGLVVITATLVASPGVTHADGGPPVALVMMENHSYGPDDYGILGDTTKYIVGNPDAHYINDVLIPHATLFTSYYANTHPSLPNYIELSAGTNAGCLSDTTCFPDTVNVENVFDLLGQAGKTFVSLAGDMPSNCYGADSGPYPVDHNPEVYFKDLDAAAAVPYGCAVTDQPLTDPLPDPLPAFTFIEPGRCDSMEGWTLTSVCPKRTDALISGGDAWLSRTVPALLARGADVFVVFDEATGGDKTNGGGHVFAAEIGPGVAEGAQDGTTYSHDSLLAALERRLGLSPLLGAAATATPLPDATGTIPGAPSVDTIPASAQPGDTIAVTGTALATTEAVTVGGAAAAFEVVDDTDLSVTVPTDAVTGPVRVTTWGGTSASASDLDIGASAAVSSIAPDHGVVGTTVAISGSGLSTATGVSFGGTSATFTVVDDADLSAVVPAGATTGSVTVSTSSGDVSAPGPFTVDPSPTLVQHAIAHGGAKTQPSVAWPSAPGANDLLTAVLQWSGSGTPVAPSGWSLALKRNGVAIYDARPSAPDAAVTVGGTGLGAWILDIAEWDHVSAPTPLDRTASATSSTLAQTTASSGTTAVTSAAGEVAIGAIRCLQNVAPTAPTNGFSALDVGHQGSNTLGVFDLVAGPPAAEGVSVTLSAAAKWRGEIVTFRPS